MKLLEPRLGLFTGVAGLRALLAGSVWMGAPLLPIIVVTQLADHLDGWLANGGPGEKANWWKGILGYRARDYIFDAIMYYALFSFMAVHGILAPFFPYYLIFFFAYPVVTYLRYTDPGSAIGIIGPPSGLFLFLVASASLAGYSPVVAGLIALGLNSILELWIHRADWRISDTRVAGYTCLASILWLTVGVAITGYFHPLLAAIPLFVLITAKEIQGARK